MVAAVYGWTHSQILQLTARQFFKYYSLIPVIEARKQSYALEASAYPNMGKVDRRRVDRRLNRILEAESEPSVDKATTSWEYLKKRREAEKVRKSKGKK